LVPICQKSLTAVFAKQRKYSEEGSGKFLADVATLLRRNPDIHLESKLQSHLAVSI
jgi:hypothetical protein